ncbi:MAG TPA: hypothetical protein VIL92_04995 [Gaiellaceae bacterium]
MPNLAALKSAARAAIVIPLVFALADKVIQQPQTSIIAAFGSFALLVFAEFSGPPRNRLLAYVGLGCVGAVLITLGTLCSRSPLLAAGAMAVVGFVALFAGVINGYFAAGSAAAILAFVLPVTIPAPNSAILDRLEGWGLATGAAILAVMLLWPPRWRANLQRDAADALRAVADFVDADGERSNEQARVARVAREAVDGLGRSFLGTQHRPTGPTAPTAALASLPDELDWLLSFLAPSTELPALELACAEDAEAMAATAAVLRVSAARLEGSDERPDFARLDAARVAVARALVRRLPELPVDAREEALPEALDPTFRIRAVTYSARQVAGYVLLATGADAPELGPTDLVQPAPARAALEATEQLAVEHASVRSVWFQNSVRGAAGLAIAPARRRLSAVPRGTLCDQVQCGRRRSVRRRRGARAPGRAVTRFARWHGGRPGAAWAVWREPRPRAPCVPIVVRRVRVRARERPRHSAAAHSRRRRPQPLACMRARRRAQSRHGNGPCRARAALGEPASRQPLAPRRPPRRALTRGTR